MPQQMLRWVSVKFQDAVWLRLRMAGDQERGCLDEQLITKHDYPTLEEAMQI